MNFKKWVKSIQTAGYNGARTVITYLLTNLTSLHPGLLFHFAQSIVGAFGSHDIRPTLAIESKVGGHWLRANRRLFREILTTYSRTYLINNNFTFTFWFGHVNLLSKILLTWTKTSNSTDVKLSPRSKMQPVLIGKLSLAGLPRLFSVRWRFIYPLFM